MTPDAYQAYAIAHGLNHMALGGPFGTINTFVRFGNNAGGNRRPYAGLSPLHFWLSMTDRDFNDGGT
jgi:hypothetical protein